MEEHSAWSFTVIKAQGLRLLHSQKSWRAIITVEVDERKHETVLGIDGQNPNLKEKFYLQEAIVDSKVQISVWNRSESKKKSKKRNLLATASHTLGELFNSQEGPKSSTLPQCIVTTQFNTHFYLDLKVPLACHAMTKRAALSRGKRRDEVALYLRLKPPAHLNPRDERDEIHQALEESETDSISNPESNDHPWRDDDTLLELSPRSGNQVRKRKTRGYTVDSDNPPLSVSEDGFDDGSTPFFKDGWDGENEFLEDDLFGPKPGAEEALVVSGAQQALGILPQHTEEVPISTDLNFIECALASFTVYRELRTANCTDHFEQVFMRLRTEWTYVGTMLVAFSGVNTTVFAISPDAIFTVDSYARRAVAASSIASGLGTACVSWIIFRYNWIDTETFKTRTKDVLGLYFFFSLSARLPSICLFLSAVFLMAFLTLVAFDAWPEGVLAVSFLVGFIMTLQFLAYGTKCVFDGTIMCISSVRRICMRQKDIDT
ncbi:hypothetical protein BDZ94DRAFT_892363 [Collybia nuda]|uniref:C2 domain-containing protein n=1 Tax=Collybia nuda TaxID=64659 RepID=A0A9P6CFV9_9AGAR|nr:hypothetical protein BDZ94DRAFT_892363 [Collybia nuda]